MRAPKEVLELASAGGGRAESDSIYEALNQALHAMVNLRNRETTFPEAKAPREIRRAVFEFPAIVCNSFKRLYRVEMSIPEEVAKIEQFFQLEVDYANLDPKAQRQNEYFLIDVVSLEELDDFCAALEADQKAMAAMAVSS